MSCYEPHPLLSRQDANAFILDFLVFGNGYLELRKNLLGQPLMLKHTHAKYTRRGEDLSQYWFVARYSDDYAFDPSSVFHVRSPSIH